MIRMRLGVAVWRLPGSLSAACGKNGGDRSLEVVDFDLEVQHLLLVGALPARRDR